jgi:hypothetical protein
MTLDALHRIAGRNDEPICFPTVIQELRRTASDSTPIRPALETIDRIRVCDAPPR